MSTRAMGGTTVMICAQDHFVFQEVCNHLALQSIPVSPLFYVSSVWVLLHSRFDGNHVFRQARFSISPVRTSIVSELSAKAVSSLARPERPPPSRASLVHDLVPEALPSTRNSTVSWRDKRTPKYLAFSAEGMRVGGESENTQLEESTWASIQLLFN